MDNEIVRKYPKGWEKLYEDEDVIANLDAIFKKLKTLGEFYPAENEIFNALEQTPLNTVEVVIVGQDPYYTKNQGNGLAFSVNRGRNVPPTLQNIYAEIKRSYPDFKIPKHGDLTAWAKQGVLLLNICLTVKPGVPFSHKKLWFAHIKDLFKVLLSVNKNVIVVMWGAKAQEISDVIGEKCKKLESSHPSPQSAHLGFNGCGHFLEINKLLKAQGKKEIDYNLD